MKQQIETALADIILELFSVPEVVELTRTDEKFGDYATNVAMKLSGRLGTPPREIAEQLKIAIDQQLDNLLSSVEIAGPGFINIRLSDEKLVAAMQTPIQQINEGKRFLLEYSCPNAFKELHTGHLYQTIIGDTLGKLLEATGATVFRANFGGDVGLHVAKCLYGIIISIGEDATQLALVDEVNRAAWISKAYVAGSQAYEQDEIAKEAIAALNSRVYQIHSTGDHESDLAKIYWTCREWSYDYFKDVYRLAEVAPFDKYYPESTTIKPGLEVVRSNMGGVFEDSDGAVVFRGENVGLHTRVFITSKNLPTYEAKDLGVIYSEINDFAYDRRIIITGNDQTQYMQVIFAALNAIDPELAAKQTHLTNGTVRFGSGQKMSSRLGNVTRAVEVVEAVGNSLQGYDAEVQAAVTLGAIKHSFLKHRLGGDIAFDIDESVSLEGNSGPYLQYAYARANSILNKASMTSDTEIAELVPSERTLVRKLGEFSEVVTNATTELMPHQICGYLYELAQTFNRFYENNRVIGNEREAVRLALVKNYADTLKNGLTLLGIPTPDQM